MRYFDTKQGWLILSVAVLLYGCGGGQEKSTSNNVGDAFSEARENVVSRVDKVIHDLPPATEVPFMLRGAGVSYRPEVPNDLRGLDTYTSFSNTKAALNLGVYAADIGYLSSFDQVQLSLDYIEGCQQLAEKLGISTAFSADLIERFEMNMSNTDSMTKIVDEGMRRVEERLEDLDQLSIASESLAGSFIEGIYIAAASIAQEKQSNTLSQEQELIIAKLLNIIIEQRRALLDLISLLKSIEQEAKLSSLIERLNELRYHYDEVSTQLETNHSEIDTPAINELLASIRNLREEIVELDNSVF